MSGKRWRPHQDYLAYYWPGHLSDKLTSHRTSYLTDWTGDNFKEYREPMDCLYHLQISFWELQLARVERRPPLVGTAREDHPLPRHAPVLLLGDVPHPGRREKYRPTAYQSHNLKMYQRKVRLYYYYESCKRRNCHGGDHR